MNISGYFGFSPENPYKTGVNVRSYKFDPALDIQSGKDRKSNGPANSAQSSVQSGEKITGTTVNNTATASTLWQTQKIAQSNQSEAIDVEEASSEKPKSKSVLEEFKDFMNKSPEELMREQILRELGYTEEELAAMDPKERAKVEAKIKELVEAKIEEAMREDGIDIDGANKTVLKHTSLMSANVI